MKSANNEKWLSPVARCLNGKRRRAVLTREQCERLIDTLVRHTDLIATLQRRLRVARKTTGAA